MFTLENLLKAYYSCRKNKRTTINALRFEMKFESNLLKLFEELQDRTYKPDRSICFVVTYPKLREVFAADFRDRIVHHLLVSTLEPYFEKSFIYASFACRKMKGLQLAITYTQKMIRSAIKNNTITAYYGQFDIRSFFASIDKEILKKIIIRYIMRNFPIKKQADLIWLTQIIINHNPTKNFYFKGDPKLLREIPPHKSLFNIPSSKGLPIGNLTSQFFANVYLNELDQFVKRVLKLKHYIRYVDDFVIISSNLEEIKRSREKINCFLQKKLQLSLHPSKDKYGYLASGIDFIGYIIRPKYRLARNRVVRNLKLKLYFFNHGKLLVSQNQKCQILPLSSPLSKDQIKLMLSMVNSYYGHFRHANCYNLRKDIYEKHFGWLKNHLVPVNDYLYFSIKRK